MAAREQPICEEHREQRHEERAEQIQEVLVVAEVDDQRADRRHQGEAADQQALRELRQEVLQADRARVDVGERLVALVHRQREQREDARRAAGRDRGRAARGASLIERDIAITAPRPKSGIVGTKYPSPAPQKPADRDRENRV